MDCSHCGAPNPNGAFICHACKASLPPIATGMCRMALTTRTSAFFGLAGFVLLMIAMVVNGVGGLTWLIWFPLICAGYLGIANLISLVLGALALREIKDSDGQLEGKEIAVVWMVVSGGLLLWLVTGIVPPLLAILH